MARLYADEDFPLISLSDAKHSFAGNSPISIPTENRRQFPKSSGFNYRHPLTSRHADFALVRFREIFGNLCVISKTGHDARLLSAISLFFSSSIRAPQIDRGIRPSPWPAEPGDAARPGGSNP